MRAFINEFVERKCPVIPAILPSAKTTPPLPILLKSLHYVDFRVTNPDPLMQLLWGITGERPKGDRRIEVKNTFRTKKSILLPDIDWVEIPEGDFGYGSQPLRQNHFIKAGFLSAATPSPTASTKRLSMPAVITRNAGGVIWKNRSPNLQPGHKITAPREIVSWYEAFAFTRWLSAQLGFEITLPTSLQWEKAARGTDGRKYPWGNSFLSGDANVYDVSADKENLEQTCAVGMYPHRASPYEVLDMAGNVWEWGKDEFNSELAIRQDSNHKVTHGGSWLDVPEYARCAFTHQDFVGSP